MKSFVNVYSKVCFLIHRDYRILLNNKPRPKVISLFTCGMGMDIGFEKSGFDTVYTNDIARFAYDTIKKK